MKILQTKISWHLFQSKLLMEAIVRVVFDEDDDANDCRPTAAALSGHELLKQIHRKHNPPPLTELLRPLNPISATSISVPGEPLSACCNALLSSHVHTKNGSLVT